MLSSVVTEAMVPSGEWLGVETGLRKVQVGQPRALLARELLTRQVTQRRVVQDGRRRLAGVLPCTHPHGVLRHARLHWQVLGLCGITQPPGSSWQA